MGCGGDDPRFATDFFDYYALDSDPAVCEALVPELDGMVRLLAEALDVGVRSRGKYVKYPDQETLQRYRVCRSTAAACAWSEEIHTTRRIDEHELVHWVMAQEIGTAIPLLFAEGAANALSCRPEVEPRGDDWDPRDFGVTLPVSNSANHAQAGRLMLGVLALTGDARTFVDLAALPRNLPGDALLARAREQLGVDLDAAWDKARELDFGSCLPLRACAGEALSWGSSELEAGCAGLPPRTLPLPAPEWRAVRLRADERLLRLLPCGVEGAPHPLWGLPAQRKRGTHELWVPLPETRHAFWMSEDQIGADRRIQITMEPLGAAFSEVCPSAREPVEAMQPLSLVLTGERPVEHFGFALESPGELYLTLQGVDTSLTLEWCADCDPLGQAIDCVPLEAAGTGRSVVPKGDRGVLRVSGAAATTRAGFLDVRWVPAAAQP